MVTDPEGLYLDTTVGGGGHSLLIFERLRGGGSLIGTDRDVEAIAEARRALPEAVTLVQARFSELGTRLKPFSRMGFHGILMDLGVSSHQIDSPERGFSHRYFGPLDLRMDQSRGQTAAELLAKLDEAGLLKILWEYGEESQARRIAKAILKERDRQPITTTEALTQVIDRAVPATRVKSLSRVFQALRIAVNGELDELDAGLVQAWSLLCVGGRLAVISYHSLEDRRVKHFFRSKGEQTRDPLGLPGMPEPEPEGRYVAKKPIVPDAAEISENPRARSAKLRVIEKLM